MGSHLWRFEKAVANLDILTPSLPLSRHLGVPICLARFPAARLQLKDESLEDGGNCNATSGVRRGKERQRSVVDEGLAD